MMTKHCSDCKKTLSIDCFWTNRSKYDGLASQCKSCQRERIRKWKKTPSGKAHVKRSYKQQCETGAIRKTHLKQKFGMTLEDYDRMFESQNGVCVICGCPEIINGHGNKIKKLAVDHNHITGKIRGLLCHSCNHALGLLNDNPIIVKSLLEYIIKND